ncbi:MAG: S-methyl-5-thioribose-1-phosphate isomerase [Deltaproteobacteria bacterium]|nr:S-methyl-5-thioribose-1-phosphate isomerase [Deltaproteobacteria bacterium]
MKDMSSLGLRFERGKLFVLDQQLLPHKEVWIECKSPQEMVDLIRRLAVRGAPLIGVAAALELARYHERGASPAAVREAAGMLRAARPTAVNLMAAVDRMLGADDLARMAEKIFDEDVELCENMARHGELLIKDGDRILTHCNTGGLATVGIGTALGVIRKAFENGKRIHVYVDETRPLLQGARLTAWELGKLGIPFTLISDNMAGMLMAQKKIDIAFVGSDRIAANGDAANKIGTYSVAVLAHYHRVPFYVVAPYTTVDKNCPTGADIPIEERNADEVRGASGPRDCAVYNPAFDVTPRKLITALVLDTGLA